MFPPEKVTDFQEIIRKMNSTYNRNVSIRGFDSEYVSYIGYNKVLLKKLVIPELFVLTTKVPLSSL